MKLFLASSLDKTMLLLFERVSKPASEARVLFVENAGDPFKEKPWIIDDREAFQKLGCELVDIDLRKITKEEFVEQMESADILHICGGSIFYLLALIKEKGFDKIIVDSVRNNKIVYTSTSAGSIIAAPSAWLYVYDKDETKFAEGMSDFSGLGLVNFLIIPHCDNPRFTESNKNMIIENLPKHSNPILLLYDSQAVWVQDNKFELVES